MTQEHQIASDSTGNLVVYEDTVHPEWTDYNGHMNVAYYLMVFDHASDAVFDQMDLGVEYRTRDNCSIFAVETHITYQREVLEGDGLRVESRILGYDQKRLLLFHEMYHIASGELAATNEAMLLHIDMTVRRAVAFPPEVLNRIEPVYRLHRHLDRPAQAGRAIKILQSLS